MRRVVTVIAVAAATVLAPPTLAFAASKDRVTGKGTTAGFDASVNAQIGQNGEKLKGSFTIDFADGTSYKVKATCVLISGNRASVGGVGPTGRETYLVVRDIGDTGDEILSATGGDFVEPDQARC